MTNAICDLSLASLRGSRAGRARDERFLAALGMTGARLCIGHWGLVIEALTHAHHPCALAGGRRFRSLLAGGRRFRSLLAGGRQFRSLPPEYDSAELAEVR